MTKGCSDCVCYLFDAVPRHLVMVRLWSRLVTKGYSDCVCYLFDAVPRHLAMEGLWNSLVSKDCSGRVCYLFDANSNNNNNLFEPFCTKKNYKLN